MKLLKEYNYRQKIYQLDFKVYKTSMGTIKEIFEADPLKFIDGVELDEDISKYIDKVCISDASTHTERLVFPAFYVKQNGERKLTFRCNQIAGKMTFMSDGGDTKSIYKPEIYERWLRKINREYN